MKLYVIEGSLTEEKYETDVKVYEVVEYVEGKKIKYKPNSVMVTEETPPNLDIFRTGWLRTDTPLVKIHTLNVNKVEKYKESIKQMIIKDLKRRQNIIENQIKIIK